MVGVAATLSRPLLAGCLCRVPAAAAAAPSTILVVGDSLSAEYGLKRGTGWVPLLEKRLDERKDRREGGQRQHQRRHDARRPLAPARPARAAQAGRRGARTGRQRRPARPAAGDDRGQPRAHDRRRRRRPAPRCCWSACRCRPTTARDYTKRFAGLFAQVAKAHKAAAGAVPAGRRRRAADPQRCSRPTASIRVAEAQPRILDNVWPELKKLLLQ